MYGPNPPYGSENDYCLKFDMVFAVTKVVHGK